MPRVNVDLRRLDQQDAVGAVRHHVLEHAFPPRRPSLQRDETTSHLGNGGGVAKVLLHELFDRTLRVRPFVSSLLRDPQLLFASQDVLLATGGEVQLQANSSQVFVRRFQPAHVLRRQHALQPQRVQRSLAEHGERNPADQVQITQSADRLLHVRLQLQRGRFAIPEVVVAGRDAGVDERAGMRFDDLNAKLPLKPTAQLGVSPEGAGLGEIGGDLPLLAGQLQTVPHAPDAVTQFEPGVPTELRHPTGRVSEAGVGAASVQKQQVDIGVRRHLAPSRSAHRDQRPQVGDRGAIAFRQLRD